MSVNEDDMIEAFLDAEETVLWEMISDLAEGIRTGGCSYDGTLAAAERAERLADLAAIADHIEAAPAR
jgi:hypothetical protein